MSRARNWCFTLNNYTDEDEANYQLVDCRYLVYGREKARTGTKHLQGYIEFSKPMRFNAVTRLLPKAHVETRLGTRQQARDYCLKEDSTPFQKGTFTESGARTDLQEVQAEILAGLSARDIADDHFDSFVRYHKSFGLYRQMHMSQELRKLEVYAYIGKPGTGKTLKAFTANPDCYILSQSNGGIWFDGYFGQKVLIIDDFDGWIPYTQLLRLLDIYPCRIELKGSFAVAEWNKVIITSNYEVDTWYDRDIGALHRRLTGVEHFQGLDSPCATIRQKQSGDEAPDDAEARSAESEE